MPFTLLPLVQRQHLPSCFFPPGIKGWPSIPSDHSTADPRTYANSWAPYHQTNSNIMQKKYPSGTIYRCPFLKQLGHAHQCHRITEGRNCISACNTNWLKELDKEIPEAKWEINSIHNDPYPSALALKRHAPGLIKVRKLPSDHLHQTPQGPQDKNSTLDPPQSSDKATQHRSSQNLTRKVQGWRKCDGTLIKHEEGQDTGSSVYHPCLNVSHSVNPRGVGITNTISRAELAAVAAATIQGYSHIATDSLTSMYQIKKQLSHPNFHRHHIQGDVLQSIAKAIHQSPMPIYFHSHIPRRYYRQWICWRSC